MRIIYILALFIFNSIIVNAQEPYIATNGGDGLGQYGYLEKDAVSFSRLERNAYNNIDFLSARWWVTDNNSSNGNGLEYLYHVYSGPDWINGIGWQCGGDNYPSKRTTDYNPMHFSPEWGAGTDCYVSVCAKYCGNSFYPSSFDGFSTYGVAGFNERHFRVLDVDTSLHVSTASMIGNAAAVCQTTNANNVAGSFSINPGAFTGIAISSLFLKNNGTALEGSDIPNTAFNVYYETQTGSEVYGDGNEIFAGTLSGNWDGNTTDSIFGSTTLNIPLNGPVRLYVLLCSFNSPVADGKHINLSIINDGISLLPAINGYSKLRVNSGSISGRNIILPLKFLQFTGSRTADNVILNWKAAFSDPLNYFTIQQSADGIHFSFAGTKAFRDMEQEPDQYRFLLNSGFEYFRIIAQFNNNQVQYSQVIRVKNNSKKELRLVQNPVTDQLLLESKLAYNMPTELTFLDISGKIIFYQSINLKVGINPIALPHILVNNRLFLLKLNTASGHQILFKVLKN